VDANEKKKSRQGLRTFAGIFLAIIGLAAFFPQLGVCPSHGYAPGNSIVNNLRQLDGATETWAMDKGVTNSMVIPSWNDLLPYLAHNQKPASVGGEQYLLGRLCNGPRAILTREYLKYPKGTVVRLVTNGAVEFLQPTKQKPSDK
jgi:hypothetical protein